MCRLLIFRLTFSFTFIMPDFMEPLLTKRGEEAARKAASEFAIGAQLADNDLGLEEDLENQADSQAGLNDKTLRVVENVCVVLLLPFFWIYDCFVFVIGARLFRWAEAMYISLRHQAHLFLNGMKPYECSARITTVNLVVLCSTWYMFIDQIRLAFFPMEADDTLAVLNFVIWTVLSLELIFEVFIRPDGYHSLIRSDKAFAPTTVRYISGLHLVVEFMSLAFFVPEFLCLFTKSGTTCSGRPVFSFLNATLLAVTGSTRIEALAGRAFYACLRLRVFGLVRHWRNMWVHTNFLKRRTKYLEMSVESRKSARLSLDTTGKVTFGEEPAETIRFSRIKNKMQQKQRDAALINASNIGTALMVTNSYRALTILCTIMGLFPMITLIYHQGVSDSVATDMVGQLQGTNLLVETESPQNCQFLVDSVESWIDSFGKQQASTLITSPTENFVIGLVLQPSRCVDYFEDMGFKQVECKSIQEEYNLDPKLSEEWCILGSLDSAHNDELKTQAQNLRLRIGNIQTKTSQIITDQGATYTVAAHFNRTRCVENS